VKTKKRFVLEQQGGGGYEDVGAVEAVNCMLLLSIEGGGGMLRFFPAWPRGEAASFQNLRASVTTTRLI
jgi:hypothetical protein